VILPAAPAGRAGHRADHNGALLGGGAGPGPEGRRARSDTISLDGTDGGERGSGWRSAGGASAGKPCWAKVLAAVWSTPVPPGFDPAAGQLKLNAVIRPAGRNDDQLLPLAALARPLGVSLRLIEFMDLWATANGWKPSSRWCQRPRCCNGSGRLAACSRWDVPALPPPTTLAAYRDGGLEAGSGGGATGPWNGPRSAPLPAAGLQTAMPHHRHWRGLHLACSASSGVGPQNPGCRPGGRPGAEPGWADAALARPFWAQRQDPLQRRRGPEAARRAPAHRSGPRQMAYLGGEGWPGPTVLVGKAPRTSHRHRLKAGWPLRGASTLVRMIGVHLRDRTSEPPLRGISPG